MTPRKKCEYLRTCFSPAESGAVRAAAGARGVSVSQHLRELALGQCATDIRKATETQRLAEGAAEAQRQEIAEKAAALVVAMVAPRLYEIALLVRELAAERNAQVMARVGAQVKAKYPSASGGLA